MKIKLMEYLNTRNTEQSIRVLASTVFDYFKNTKEALEDSAEEISAENLKTAIIAQLIPSVLECTDEQINLIITLIIKEYTDRYHLDCPVWADLVEKISRGEII